MKFRWHIEVVNVQEKFEKLSTSLICYHLPTHHNIVVEEKNVLTKKSALNNIKYSNQSRPVESP